MRQGDDEKATELANRQVVQLFHEQFGLLVPEEDIEQAISKTEGIQH